jgi:hypothetical protein
VTRVCGIWNADTYLLLPSYGVEVLSSQLSVREVNLGDRME